MSTYADTFNDHPAPQDRPTSLARRVTNAIARIAPIPAVTMGLCFVTLLAATSASFRGRP